MMAADALRQTSRRGLRRCDGDDAGKPDDCEGGTAAAEGEDEEAADDQMKLKKKKMKPRRRRSRILRSVAREESVRTSAAHGASVRVRG